VEDRGATPTSNGVCVASLPCNQPGAAQDQPYLRHAAQTTAEGPLLQELRGITRLLPGGERPYRGLHPDPARGYRQGPAAEPPPNRPDSPARPYPGTSPPKKASRAEGEGGRLATMGRCGDNGVGGCFNYFRYGNLVKSPLFKLPGCTVTL